MSASLATAPSIQARTVAGRLVGAAVLSGAGTWWGWEPVARLSVPPAVAHAILVTVGLMLFVAAARAIAAHRGPAIPVDRRLMMISMIGEVPAIAVGTSLVAWLGRPDLTMPVVGLVVGLHFLPMARALSYPPYRTMGLAITAFALLSMAFSGPTGLVILGAGTGASLWLTLLDMTLRLRARTRAVRRLAPAA